MVYLDEGSSTRFYPDIPTIIEVFNHNSSLILRGRQKNVISKKKRLLGEIAVYVEPPQISLIKTEQVWSKKESDYAKVKLRRNPASETYETYEVKLVLFENVEPE